jgi:hypothetical protein
MGTRFELKSRVNVKIFFEIFSKDSPITNGPIGSLAVGCSEWSAMHPQINNSIAKSSH